jgi:hypothetical protein
VAANPTTDTKLEPQGRNVIRDREAALWAGLANVRYRMLLASLIHAFATEGASDGEKRSPRGLLISWSFGEMYHLRCISDILMSLPLAKDSKLFSGPPFEMPYTLGISDREQDRWRLHRDLILASRQYSTSLLSISSSHTSYLKALIDLDRKSLDQVQTLIGN